jgi:hypothetical protein
LQLKEGLTYLKSINYTYAIAIAGIATSGMLRGGRYSPEDVLNATAKMYAGVKVKNGIPDTPTHWEYMTNDNRTKNINTHRTLQSVNDSDQTRAGKMYDAIVGLAKGDKTDESDELLQTISTGATVLGPKFQLLFHFNTGGDDKISGDGLIRYNDELSFKRFVVENNTIISSAMKGKGVLNLMNSLLGATLRFAAAPDADGPSDNTDLSLDGGRKSTRRKRKGSRKKGSSKKPVSHKKRKSGASKKKRSHPKKK